MRKKIKELYEHSTLVAKIRYSYLCLLVPFVLFLIFCFYNLWNNNRRYEDMINSSVMASQFSLDFQKDFDYETYLLIVGNKTLEESSLHDMLVEADGIVAGLEELTESQENLKRLTSVKKYLNNLETYIGRYEDNMEIWENDVQIVTSLVGDTISQYIYYEIRGIQESRQQYQDFFVNMIRFSIIAFALILILFLFLSYYIPLSITSPIRRLTQVTDQVAKGDLTVRSDVTGGVEAQVLSDSLNTMIDKINELLEQVKTEQIRLRKAEFELLQSQINPHFLFNSLNTISYFCREKPEKARELLLALSSYFRSMLEDTDYMVTLDTELEHVKAYTMLEEARFEKRLSIEINADPEALRSCVPNLILQPIVENAVHHGAMQREKGVGKVIVNVKREERSTRIDVIDNGPGMDYRIVQSLYGGEKVEHTGIGMMNVQQRLISLYGKSYGLQIVTSEEGTDVRMNIPDSAAGENDRLTIFRKSR